MTRLLGDAQRGSYVQPDKLTLSEWVEKRWLPSLSVRESTKHSYARNLRTHVLPRLGSVHLQKITPSDLNTLYRSLSSDGNKGHRMGEGLSPRTVRYVHTIIGRTLGDAVLENLLTVNPAQRATPPRAREATEAAPPMVTWSGPQLARFLEATAADRYGPAFYFLATSGMRRGEALGLTWEDVDLDAARISIRRALIVVGHEATMGSTKTGRSRVIELDAGTVAVLRQQWKRQAEDRLLIGPAYDGNRLFCHATGEAYHPDRFSREFDRKLTRFNKDHASDPLPRIRLHDLRHTWASLALRAGVHPKVVADRLGHTTTNITLNIYSHVVEGMQTTAAENVAAALFGA
jgi:integrase